MIFTTKKTIAIILAVMVCLSLIACSSSNKTDKKAALKGTWTISEITIGNDNEPYEDSDLSNIIIELYGDGVGLLTTPLKDLFFPGYGQSTIVYADTVFYMNGKEYAYRYNGKEIAVDYDTEEGTIHLLLNRTSSSTATMHNTGNNKKPSNSIIGVWSATGARLNGRHLTGRELKDQIGSVSITLMENGVGILHYKDGFLNMTETLAYDGETYTVMGKTIPYIYYPNTIETTVYFGFDSGVDLIFTN